MLILNLEIKWESLKIQNWVEVYEVKFYFSVFQCQIMARLKASNGAEYATLNVLQKLDHFYPKHHQEDQMWPHY